VNHIIQKHLDKYRIDKTVINNNDDDDEDDDDGLMIS